MKNLRYCYIRFYMFDHIKTTRFQLPSPIFSFSAWWQLFARSALDIELQAFFWVRDRKRALKNWIFENVLDWSELGENQ